MYGIDPKDKTNEKELEQNLNAFYWLNVASWLFQIFHASRLNLADKIKL